MKEPKYPHFYVTEPKKPQEFITKKETSEFNIEGWSLLDVVSEARKRGMKDGSFGYKDDERYPHPTFETTKYVEIPNPNYQKELNIYNQEMKRYRAKRAENVEKMRVYQEEMAEYRAWKKEQDIAEAKRILKSNGITEL